MLVACASEVCGGREIGAGDRPRGRGFDRTAVCSGKTGQGYVRRGETSVAADAVGGGAVGTTAEVAGMERTAAAEASHGGSGDLYAGPMGGVECVHGRWCGA